MKYKRFLKIFICISVCAVILVEANAITLPKDRNYMVSQALKEETKNSLEVIAFGSCHTYTSFNPIQLFQEYGVPSFNYGKPSEIFPGTYLSILEALKTQTPKVILVEIWGINPYNTYLETEETLNYYFTASVGAQKLSKEKIEVVQDYDALGIGEVFPLVRNKSRIIDGGLTKQDFVFDWSTIQEGSEMDSRINNKGFSAHMRIIEEDGDDWKQIVANRNEEKEKLNSDIKKYLDKILEVCRNKDIDVIFYRAPYASKSEEYMHNNELEDYLKKKNIPYFDLEEYIDFDYQKDFCDSYHLNASGAEKVTSFLGKYLMEHYNLNDCRGMDKYQEWENLSVKYTQ